MLQHTHTAAADARFFDMMTDALLPPPSASDSETAPDAPLVPRAD
mgnify:CR=1 FL=1